MGVVVEDHSLVDLVAGGHVGAIVGGVSWLGHSQKVGQMGVADAALVEGVDGVSEQDSGHEGKGNDDLGHSGNLLRCCFLVGKGKVDATETKAWKWCMAFGDISQVYKRWGKRKRNRR